jgi:ATP-dependent DNA helicase RecG
VHGFDRAQQEQMVLNYVAAHGQITRSEAANLCALSSSQASRLLRDMARDGGPLVATGAGRVTGYARRT